ncbi:MAG: hypothetical protein PVH28_04850 [Desulfobacterales bacterium]
MTPNATFRKILHHVVDAQPQLLDRRKTGRTAGYWSCTRVEGMLPRRGIQVGLVAEIVVDGCQVGAGSRRAPGTTVFAGMLAATLACAVIP